MVRQADQGLAALHCCLLQPTGATLGQQMMGEASQSSLERALLGQWHKTVRELQQQQLWQQLQQASRCWHPRSKVADTMHIVRTVLQCAQHRVVH